MSKKISKEEFLRRFFIVHPDENIEIMEYSAISNPAVLKCKNCGKIYKKSRARDFLSKFHCCGTKKTNSEQLKEIYSKNKDFSFIKKIDRNTIIVKHNKCGNEMKRYILSAMDNPFACKYCNTLKSSNMLSIKEVQKKIDEQFFGSIKILDYNGQLKKNHYKCLKCGLIFTQQHICLVQSRGCPKCDRYKSKGERQVAHLLEEKGIIFQEQYKRKELPLQSFDFAIFNNKNELLYLIEVQGEQHYRPVEIFSDSLEKIQERDERKRKFCQENNILLYELICEKGKIKNLDILPFSSTTISAKESTI